MKELTYLNKYFFKYRTRLFLGIIFIAISNIFGVFPAAIIRNAFDLVGENISYYHSSHSFLLQQTLYSNVGLVLLLFGITILILAVLKGVFLFFTRQTIIVMSRLIEFDLRNDVYDHYQKLDMAFFKRNNTGDLMSRVTEDISRVRMYLGPALMYSINLIVLVVMVISVMLQVNAELTSYVLLPLPILSVTIYYVNNLIHRKSEIIQKQLSFLTTISQEAYAGIRLIKSFVQEKPIRLFFGEQSENYRIKTLKLATVEAFFFPTMLLLIGLSTIITIFIGGIAVNQGKVSPGNVAEFVIYVNMLTWPVTAIGWVASLIQRAAASQKRINEFLNTKPEIRNSGGVKEINYNSAIKFDNVSFTYSDTNIQALKNITFTIEPGEKIAIIGNVGSGKSTVAQLLIRLYDVTSGKIEIGGVDIRKGSLQLHRKNIGYVPQDVFLFSDSVANNIAYGIEKPNREKIENTAKHVFIDEDIRNLSDKYDTILGERGVNLSGGQKQRISIARALIKNPEIMIFDDCLSAIDTQTEKAILNNLNEILQNKICIIITHRILSLIDVNKIIVMEDGAIIEEGTHENLLLHKGLYYKLYEKQKLEESNLEK